jgi:ABC-2 type transport system permease protein
MLLRDIYAKTLRDHWKGILGWGLGLAAIAALEIMVYPSIRERADEMNRLVANYPEAFKAMFGLEDFTSGAGFIQAELYSLVVPLVLIALAISFGAGATAGEEEHKTVDLWSCRSCSPW